MAGVRTGVSRSRVPDLAGRCDPVVERAIRDLYLRFYKFPASVTNVTQVTAPVEDNKKKPKTPASVSAYTIVFTIDGPVGDDQLTPSFTVNSLRDGYSPSVASLTADFAPDGSDLSINFLLEGVPMLAADLVVVNGTEGPSFANSFALPNKVAQGKRIRMKIVSSGNAAQVVGELVMKRVS